MVVRANNFSECETPEKRRRYTIICDWILDELAVLVYNAWIVFEPPMIQIRGMAEIVPCRDCAILAPNKHCRINPNTVLRKRCATLGKGLNAPATGAKCRDRFSRDTGDST